MLETFMDWPDSVDVYRAGVELSAGHNLPTGHALLISGLECQIGPMDALTQRKVFGNFSIDRRMIVWGTYALKTDDRIVFQERFYKLKPAQNDTNRPSFSIIPQHQTAYLELDPRPKITAA